MQKLLSSQKADDAFESYDRRKLTKLFSDNAEQYCQNLISTDVAVYEQNYENNLIPKVASSCILTVSYCIE